MFAEEYHDLVEETKVNSRVAGFHYANAMQEIGGALEHISMAAGSDRGIVTNLTEVVEQLTKNNAPLMKQLSNNMKLNL